MNREARTDQNRTHVIVVPNAPRRIALTLSSILLLVVICVGIAFFVEAFMGRVQKTTVAAGGISGIPQRELVRSWRLAPAFAVSVVVYLFAWKIWFQGILSGRSWAIILGYVAATLCALYIGAGSLFFVTRVFLPTAVSAALSGILAVAIVAVSIRSVTSLLSKNWLSMDGRCPNCRKWTFGFIHPPHAVECGECGDTIEFRRPCFRIRCPECVAKLNSVSWEMVGDVGVCPRCKAEFEIQDRG